MWRGHSKMDGLNEEVVRSWDWSSGELGLGPGSAARWMRELCQITS